MKTTKEKADEILSKINGQIVTDEIWHKSSRYAKQELIRKALIVVKHTIEVLELMKSEYIKRNYICPEIIMSLQEQTELLTELKSRL